MTQPTKHTDFPDPSKVHKKDWTCREVSFSRGDWRATRHRTSTGSAFIKVNGPGTDFTFAGEGYVQAAEDLAAVLEKAAEEMCKVPDID